MGKKRHKPPSRIRYEKTHPVVSFRVKDEWYDAFKAFLQEQNLSIGDFFRISYEKQKANYQKAHNQGFNKGYRIGYNAGYEKGKEEWGIQFPCSICGELVYIPPNSDCHQAVIEFLKSRHWAHGKCIEK